MTLAVNDFIPQRYPFELIDRILSVEAGVRARAEKLVTVNEWFFQSPTATGRTMPRPLLLEILAQTGVVALLSVPDYRGQNVFFGGIKTATFLANVHPGDDLVATVTLTKQKRQIGVGHGTITCDQQVIVEADLIFIREA